MSSNNTSKFLPFLENQVQQKAWGIFIFILAGMFEIGGGWLVWQTIRESQPAWYAVIGSFVLVGYGFIATLQPLDDFARVYAIYGAFFILLSILWGVVVDKFRPDVGDGVGTAIVITGALVMFFWPRPSTTPEV